MPGNRHAALAAELQAAGIGAEIPCAVISRATTKDETIYRTTVGKLPECPAGASPSLLVVGVVVGVSEDLNTPDIALSSNTGEEVLQLALRHPYNNIYGRGCVE